MTSNHVLGMKVVLPDGEVVSLGSESLESVGPDLVGLFVTGRPGWLNLAPQLSPMLRCSHPERAGGKKQCVLKS
jgi:glycolate oxidase